MPWEDRRGHKYFYLARRINGKPRRLYFGNGCAAELASATEQSRRLDREIKARQEKEERATQTEAHAPLHWLCEVTDILARASLVACGYYRHDRGEWRYRHGKEVSNRG